MGEKPTAALRAATRICLLVLVAVVAGLACSPSSKADPRCKIDAEGRHFDKLSQTINGSKLWSTYFDAIDPEATRTLVELRFLIGRGRDRSMGGDYDSGRISIFFEATHLASKRTLYDREEEVDLEPFMVGFFDKDVTRERVRVRAHAPGSPRRQLVQPRNQDRSTTGPEQNSGLVIRSPISLASDAAAARSVVWSSLTRHLYAACLERTA
jgi:hypothetical protein